MIKYVEEIMTNNDNLESNLLTSSLLKRCLVYMLVQVELRILCTGNLPLQVNYAVGRLVAVIVYCFTQWFKLIGQGVQCGTAYYSIVD